MFIASHFICKDIKIGFERAVYTVEEGSSLESQVFITKFDGYSTEEDIDIRITAIPQTAELGKIHCTYLYLL